MAWQRLFENGRQNNNTDKNLKHSIRPFFYLADNIGQHAWMNNLNSNSNVGGEKRIKNHFRPPLILEMGIQRLFIRVRKWYRSFLRTNESLCSFFLLFSISEGGKMRNSGLSIGGRIDGDKQRHGMRRISGSQAGGKKRE